MAALRKEDVVSSAAESYRRLIAEKNWAEAEKLARRQQAVLWQERMGLLNRGADLLLNTAWLDLWQVAAFEAASCCVPKPRYRRTA